MRTAAGNGGKGERVNRGEGREKGKEMVRKQEQFADFGLDKNLGIVRAVVRRTFAFAYNDYNAYNAPRLYYVQDQSSRRRGPDIGSTEAKHSRQTDRSRPQPRQSLERSGGNFC